MMYGITVNLLRIFIVVGHFMDKGSVPPPKRKKNRKKSEPANGTFTGSLVHKFADFFCDS